MKIRVMKARLRVSAASHDRSLIEAALVAARPPASSRSAMALLGAGPGRLPRLQSCGPILTPFTLPSARASAGT
jgi:hypothetical protein